MTKRQRIGAMLAGLLLAGAAGAGVGALRRAEMHRAGEIMQALRREMLAGRDPAALQPQTDAIAAWSDKLMELFPPGSEGSDPYSLPTVWANRAGFEAQERQMRAAAAQLSQAARAGDKPAFAAAYRAAAAACGACHRAFRKR